MSFLERPASKQWAALKYKGVEFAQVWFKPVGEPFGVTFRIPQENFQLPGLRQDLTIENLLKAVGIAPDEVGSWRIGDVSHLGLGGSNPDFANTLSPPAPDATHLEIHVRLKFSAAETDISAAKWHDLEARWKAILGIEATVDTLRIGMQGLLQEMENSFKKILTSEEKTYALRADVAAWERAKHRVHFALPKLKDFIHRAVWSLGSPERKKLGELYDDYIQPHVPFPGMDEVLKQLEELQKDRQVLSVIGNTVYQESKAIATDVQGALRTLQNNAAMNAKNKRNDSSGKGGKFFKSVRRWSGA